MALAVAASGATEVTFYANGVPQPTMTLDETRHQAQLYPSGLALTAPTCIPHSDDVANRCLEDVAKHPLGPGITFSYLGVIDRNIVFSVTEDSCEGYSVKRGPDNPKTGTPQFLLMPMACRTLKSKVSLREDGKQVPLTFQDSSTKFLGDYALSAQAAKP